MNFFFLFLLPVVFGTNTDEKYGAYYYSTWVFMTFFLLFYVIAIAAALPYSRPRIPIILFVLLVFFPPFFFAFLFWLLVIVLITPPPPQIVEVRPTSRRDLGRV